MSYNGTVRNGIVVLEPGANLPEGAQVRVEQVEPIAKPAAEYARPEDDPLFDMSKYAVKTGIPDLATNLDHYLYGHPKVTDDR